MHFTVCSELKIRHSDCFAANNITETNETVIYVLLHVSQYGASRQEHATQDVQNKV